MKSLKNILTKMIVGTLFSIIVLSASMTSVHASTSPRIPGNHQLVYGIGNFNYYITDSVLNHQMSSTWETLIANAAYSWEVTGYGWNPLYAHRTYNYYNSNMDIYLSQQMVEGYIMGNVTYWTGTSPNATQVNPQFSDWVFTEVTMFVNMYNWNDSNTMQRYIAHFFGQTFGLDNNSDSYSVMCSFYTPCYVYLPSQADHNGLNAIYNN